MARRSSETPAPQNAGQGESGRQGTGRLHGKSAVVTGAARGIGRAIAVAYAREGAHVMGIDIAGPVSAVTSYPPATPQDLEETGRQVQAFGRDWRAITADVRDIEGLRRAADEAMGAFGRIDIVVGDAGIQTFAPLLEMDDAHWHDIIDVNLTGGANTVRAFAPRMAERRQGRIILVASTQGRRGMKDGASYSASKWGIIGLAKSAALDLGPYGITVNALVPGLVDTPMTRNAARWTEVLKQVEKDPPQPPPEADVVRVQVQRTPLQIPWLKPEDIAPMAVFLASDEAHWVSGAVLDVTAGDSAHYTG